MDRPSTRPSAATVKKAGAGARPVSILRSVSAEMPASAAISVMLRPPRASRSSRGMVELKTDPSIDATHAAGRIVGQALTAVREEAHVGVSLLELDEMAREVLRERGAGSPFVGYRPSSAPTPFPAVICASVNDAIAHGIPGRYRLRDGDPVSIDCGAEPAGWVGDSAISFTVDRPRSVDVRLVEAAERALVAGITAAVVGNRTGDIAHAIGSVCRATGFGIPEGSAGTAWAVVCTRTPPCRTRDARAGGSPCGTAWSWRSSPC